MRQYLKTTIEQAASILTSANNIALFAHTRPDGDAIGATVALRLALERAGKSVKVFCDTKLGPKLAQFEETACVSDNLQGKFDLYVAVDCGDLFRLGEFCGEYDKQKETLTIDHHCGEKYSKYNCLYPYASCCQIVYEILKVLNLPIDGTIATYLYMGLCTDTGNFSHNNTDKQCFMMAAYLCEKGADMEKVNRVFFKDIDIGSARLLAVVLKRMRSYFDGKLILLYVLKSDFEELGVDMSATEGLVQYAVNIDSARVGICMCEYAENVFKVSARGKDFDVRDVCKDFGGGGHMYAAGCMISGFFEDVAEKLVRAVEIRL